jgi:hypothetical protein
VWAKVAVEPAKSNHSNSNSIRIRIERVFNGYNGFHAFV